MKNRNEELSNNQICFAWLNSSVTEMHWYEELLVFVEIGEILERAHSRQFSWQQLSSSLCGTGVPIVSHISIAQTIMSLHNNCYTTTRILNNQWIQSLTNKQEHGNMTNYRNSCSA